MTKKPLRPLEVAMNDILEAMTAGPDDPLIAFLDRENGSVVHDFSPAARLDYGDLVDEDDEIHAAIEAEPDRFVEIEPLGSKRLYALMAGSLRRARAKRGMRSRPSRERSASCTGSAGASASSKAISGPSSESASTSRCTTTARRSPWTSRARSGTPSDERSR